MQNPLEPIDPTKPPLRKVNVPTAPPMASVPTAAPLQAGAAPPTSAPKPAPGASAPVPTATTGGAPAAANPSAPYAQLSGFGPSTNLIGTTIAPNATRPSATAYQPVAPAATGNAMQSFQQANNLTQQMSTPGYEAVGATDFGDTRRLLGLAENTLGQFGQGYAPSAGVTALNASTQAQLDKVLNGPDRSKLAADQYQLLTEQSAPQFAQNLRAVGQKAAAFGRLGAGMTTNDLTDVNSQHETMLDQARRQLATDTAGQTLDDRLKQLDAVNSIRGSLAASDLGGFNAGNANAAQRFDMLRALAGDYGNLSNTAHTDQLTERDARIGAADRNNQVLQGRAQGFGTLGTQQYGAARDAYGDAVNERDAGVNNARYQDTMDAADRAELRGERGFQYGLSQDATDNALRQRMAEDQLTNSGTDRNLALLGAGSQGSPVGLYGQQANTLQQEGDNSLSSALDLFARSGYGSGGGGSVTSDAFSVPQIAGDFSGAVPGTFLDPRLAPYGVAPRNVLAGG